MSSKHYNLIAVVLVSLVLSVLYCPPFDIYFDDKEIFKYSGFLIKRGEIPYKDFFDHKPPLIFFINYFGLLIGNWGLWILDTLLVLWASVLFLKTNIKFNISYPAVLPIVFNLIIRNSTISFGIGMTREYTTILILIGCCVVLTNARYKYFYFGLLSALIFFFQQEQAVILIPFVLYSFLVDIRSNEKKPLVSIILLLLGGLAVVVPILLYFFINNVLNEFWQYAFIFNTQWYTTEQKPGIIKEIIQLKNYIYQLNFEIIFISALLMSAVSFFVGNKRKGLLAVSLLSIFLSFISEFLSGKLAIGNASCTYYLLPLAATLPFTLFVVFAFTEKQIFQNRIHQFIYSALLLLSLILNILVYIVNYHKYPQDWIAKSKEVKYLQKSPPSDYQLYVFNNSNFIYAYNRFSVLPPSKWLYHYFWSWYPSWDEDAHIMQSITADLKKHKTRYIIYDPKSVHFQREMNHEVWKAFIDSFYHPVAGLNLWEINK